MTMLMLMLMQVLIIIEKTRVEFILYTLAYVFGVLEKKQNKLQLKHFVYETLSLKPQKLHQYFETS